jgi:hypothetical protein
LQERIKAAAAEHEKDLVRLSMEHTREVEEAKRTNLLETEEWRRGVISECLLMGKAEGHWMFQPCVQRGYGRRPEQSTDQPSAARVVSPPGCGLTRGTHDSATAARRARPEGGDACQSAPAGGPMTRHYEFLLDATQPFGAESSRGHGLEAVRRTLSDLRGAICSPQHAEELETVLSRLKDEQRGEHAALEAQYETDLQGIREEHRTALDALR